MMVTIQAAKRALGICLLLLLVASCSREQQDWRSAEAADSIESYGQFIQRHPGSELTTQARMRVAQLAEDRDWQRAGSADTADAYRQFIAQHPTGKWVQEARIRLDNFSLAQSREGAGSSADAVIDEGKSVLTPRPADSVRGEAHAYPDGGAYAPGGAGGLAVAGEAATRPTGAGAGRVPAGVETTVVARNAGGLAAAPAGAGAGGPPGADAGSGTGAGNGAGAASEVAGGVGTGATAATGAGAGNDAGTRSAVGSGVNTTVDPGAGGFGIQLGAFSSQATAASQWGVLSGQFGAELQGLSQRIVAADTPSGRVYRLQATVGDEARARGICDALRRRSHGCVLVLPH